MLEEKQFKLEFRPRVYKKRVTWEDIQFKARKKKIK